jgi:hypothetical protein
MAIRKLLFGKSPGSLIPLSFGFFLIAICLAFISINISTAYALKKELTNIGEAAINKAAHSLNLFAYYGEINRYQSNKRVPLDCQLANTAFSKLVQSTDFSGKKIAVERFTCDLYELSAQISVTGRMPIQIPFLT